MGKINWTRVLLGGIVAGVVINVFEFVVNGLLLADDWAASMEALGKSPVTTTGQMVMFVLWSFVAGLTAVWLYASIRPRYGPGPKTALCAGAAVWWLAFLMAMVPPMVMDIMPARLVAIGLAAGLVELLLGTLAGARVYKEQTAVAGSTTAAAGAGV